MDPMTAIQYHVTSVIDRRPDMYRTRRERTVTSLWGSVKTSRRRRQS